MLARGMMKRMVKGIRDNLYALISLVLYTVIHAMEVLMG